MPGEPTAPELGERVRLFFEAANRPDLATVMSIHAPDAVYDLSLRGLGVFEGEAAIRGFLEDYLAAFEDLEWEVEEMLGLDDRVVLLVVRQQGRPVNVDVRLRQREAWVQSYSTEGMLVRASSYLDIDEGRAAARQLVMPSGPALSPA
jgi:ketosteroid isomerase-like protein